MTDKITKKELIADHNQLKEEAWSEWLEMTDLVNSDGDNRRLMREAYDYGWYNAYGLCSEDKRHDEMIILLKELKDSIGRI